MLTIRKAQFAVFDRAHRSAFENEMMAHSQTFSPKLCRVLGDAQLRIAVRNTLERAEVYGFTDRGPKRLMIEMMFLFGSHFDTDPQYPWARDILNAPTHQMERAEDLYHRIHDYQDRVSGPQARHTRRALNNLSSMAHQTLTLPPEGFGAGMLDEMSRIFPQKAVYVGNTGLRRLIREGRGVAQRCEFSTAREYALVIALMYAFGHGCTHDPLYPWISRTLEDPRIPDPATRARRLEKKALTWLDHVLAAQEPIHE